MYWRNFYLKTVVKSSLPAWFLTKNVFFTFDSRMMSFDFLWPRNEIWKHLGVFWKLANALGAYYASFWKNWILLLKPSFLVVFTYSEHYTGKALSCDGHFRSPITSRAVRKASKTSWEMPEIIMNHILEPKSNQNSPAEFASQWKLHTVEISASK